MRDHHLRLNERIELALARIRSGHGQMRVPVEATDPDVVLRDCQQALKAKDEKIGWLKRELARCRPGEAEGGEA